MATLVLTAVGSVLGGPVGAAIGGLVGQTVDREVLFAPKGRQGPRLTELKLQTSSYGTPIPLQFGTMRVAGSVIWATDLIESRKKSSAGKGQPKVTTYSYAASFAVALSGRAVLGIGRIWADGKLLRGAAGDFKSELGAFRLHTGDEDQAVDPLIASAEGLAMTPAHRGVAYAVFEQLQLADYGNRIPSLTFEVIADAGAPSVATMVEAIGGEAVDGGEGAATLAGFSAYGDSARAVLETLADTVGGWWSPDGEQLVLRTGDQGADPIADQGASANGRGARRARSVAPVESVARTLTLSHYDAARDYQVGVQRARRPGAGDATERVELPAVMAAGAAKALAEAMLARREDARTRRTVASGPAAMTVRPGDQVTIAGEGGRRWRVTEAALERFVVELTLVPARPVSAVATTASAGRVAGAPDLAPGRTILHLTELPALDDALLAAPRLTIVAAGDAPGWRRAALLLSTDAGASWRELGGTAAPAVLGTVAVPPGACSSGLVDRANAVEVELAHDAMELVNADGAALDAGANLALIGDELLQFGLAKPLGERRWRLSQLLRGRRGTEAAIGAAAAGDRFVLLDADTALAIDLPAAALNSEVRVIAQGLADDPPVSAAVMIEGASVRPPAPCQLTWSAEPDGGAMVTWVRRSRAGWRWSDGVDVPLGEEAEAYRVAVTSADGVRELTVGESIVAVGAAERAGGASVSVRQLGTLASSLPTTIIIPAA